VLVERSKEKMVVGVVGEVVVVYSREPVVGIFEDIDQEGSLLLRTAQGLLKFNAGEVSLRGSKIF
jgi:BirA family biotin operon repressor/biotin-[acetyl-CoA-carboxylase] ligase